MTAGWQRRDFAVQAGRIAALQELGTRLAEAKHLIRTRGDERGIERAKHLLRLMLAEELALMRQEGGADSA